ncbi:GH3 auxin-responsive promoter [Pisolithus orientalis]|uniref:GH3 auxin-responsive promoter n=1 Tax=Pisolithus orientalis TaxID=936130 RepID=UPI002224100F|nr:GH3 auxin-responsive promoter [Pisolithus orientalis]KAI6009406.1 GH3 auxin-responsive promoter [Pisolithus orientalis]
MSTNTVHPTTTLTPELEAVLKEDTDRRLRDLIAMNSKSRYARSSSSLSDFRLAIENTDVQTDESVLADFRRLVPLTDYESYRPFFDKFNSRPCKLSEVEDMFAPGLPVYIPLSSATTNRKSKQFVKYFRSQPYAHGPPPLRIKTTAFLFTFAYRDPVEVVTDSGEVTKRIPLCNQSSGVMRLQNNWSIETDDTRMGSILPGHVAPWATGFIIHHRSFLLIHALFALANTSLEGFAVTFLPYFIDMVHRIKEEWDVLVSGIRNGIIPDFDQIDHVRPYLQVHLRTDPQRADELQSIGPPLSYSGWAQRVWPNLKLLKGICSGTFAAALPQARSVLGPNVIIHNTWYICTEGLIGRTLNFEDTETFVIAANDLIEFLDMTEGETNRKILQAWELQPGMFYQPVSTTYDGLWRYLIDDVIQVTGFDPRNGLPVFRYSRRKNLELRLPHAMITEADLVSVIHAISGEDTVQVHEFTTVVDDRKFPQTVGFFIGITGDIGPNAKFARQKAFAALAATSEEHQIAFDGGELGLPTIRIVKPETFADYRRWRGESMKFGVGQIKVPVVLSDSKAQEWIAERVMMEL